MKHRSHLPQQEREARSRLIKVLRDKPFIAGGLVRMARTCGKAGCKCTKGDKHVSWYLATRHKGSRKMICIPRQREQEVIDQVNIYKEIIKLVDLVSQQCLGRFTTSIKEGRQKDS
jgi:hypothetical protein